MGPKSFGPTRPRPRPRPRRRRTTSIQETNESEQRTTNSPPPPSTNGGREKIGYRQMRLCLRQAAATSSPLAATLRGKVTSPLDRRQPPLSHPFFLLAASATDLPARLPARDSLRRRLLRAPSLPMAGSASATPRRCRRRPATAGSEQVSFAFC
jgi:hypothetical protein